MTLVLDASMAISWLLDDEAASDTANVLLRVADEGAVVPQLWRLEVANVLRNAVRRGRCDQDHVDKSLQRLGRLPISVDEETDVRAWTETLDLSRAEGLTLYDAAYLELALRRRAPLATCDADLLRAARKFDLEVATA